MLVNENAEVLYVLKVGGREVSARHESQILAEMDKNNLPADQQKSAVIEQVTPDGKQVLRG